jgi:thiosulfate/3-mercaptopyruvate sulfurtransferase
MGSYRHSPIPHVLGLALLLALATTSCGHTDAAGGPWSADEALSPADLAATLKGSGPKPVIVYVGYRALFHPGRIPGATFHGPSSQPEGIADLKRWAATQSKDRPVVVYCGCCPLAHCPNLVPAYAALKQLGFARVQVLILPTNFEVDWVDQGYPVERSAPGGQSPS